MSRHFPVALVVPAMALLTLVGVFPWLGGDASGLFADQGATSQDRRDGAGQASRQGGGTEKENPFSRRVRIPGFPREGEWLNVGGPLRMRDLQGKFVLFDFWTYCCINCIHILPELKKLERAYPDELVVIGVHSAKFETEKDKENIEKAILRYEIEHPVLNDATRMMWKAYNVRSWPTVLLIDPEGYAVWYHAGEITFEMVDRQLKAALPYYRQQGLLDETPLHFDLLAHSQDETPLRFPGKVLTDAENDRLFIADSNHNRIVVTTLDGQLQETIGSGQIGREDGDFQTASFDHPQGMALAGQVLYVADTENHLLRKIDLQKQQVETIAGTGVQGRRPWPGLEQRGRSTRLPRRWVGKPLETALASPWALYVHEDDLYIAMAGPHQIWKMPLDESEVGPYAGNAREDIVDGRLLPKKPYDLGFASFAQPSGLASDGQWLYVADSEGSSVRAVPFDPSSKVRTVVGTANLPKARLFTFGDRDGPRKQVLLQHVLGIVHHEGELYIADTYNNKIKVIDAESGMTKTLAGNGEPGSGDNPAQFDEPAGITYANGILYVADTNNHLIRTVNPETGEVGRLEIEDLDPPETPEQPSPPDFTSAKQIQLDSATVAPAEGAIELQVSLKLPPGWKINELGPAAYWLEADGEQGPIDRAALGRKPLADPGASFKVPVPVQGSGKDALRIATQYFYCQEGGEGLCKVGSVVWNVPLRIAAGGADHVQLEHSIEP